MNPVAYYNEIERTIQLASPVKDSMGADWNQVPLYTISEVGDFIKGLYFDDTYASEKPLSFARIVEILHQESNKNRRF